MYEYGKSPYSYGHKKLERKLANNSQNPIESSSFPVHITLYHKLFY